MNKLKKYAGLLNEEAPENHFLAYITKDEKDMLIKAGGSGKMTPQGILSFEESWDSSVDSGGWDMDDTGGADDSSEPTSGNGGDAGDPNQYDMTTPAQDFPDYESGSPENTRTGMSDEMANRTRELTLAQHEAVLGDHGDPMGSPDEQAKYARYVKYTVKDQAPPKKKSFLGALATGIAWYTGLAPLLGLKVPAVVQTLGTGFKMKKQLDYGVKEYNKRFGTNYSFDEFIAKTTDHLKKEHAERKEKMALYKSLPDGHPEKIALSVELQIGKKPEHLGDGDNIDITYENIEETNDLKEKVRASGETMDLLYAPKKEDRSKQMAYWQSLMAPYMGGAMGMAAEGGRVPGYNTGGLSSLFRLKNK